MSEQRDLDQGRAIVDRSDLVVAAISGADRLSWVNSLSSQLVTGRSVGESMETLFLDATGRIEHVARLLDDGERTWLILEPAHAEELLAWLRSMVFMLRVSVEEHPELSVIGSMRGAASDAVTPHQGNGIPLRWTDPWSTVAPGGYQYFTGHTEHPGAQYFAELTLVERAEHDRLSRDSDIAVAGLLAWDALRIAAWRPLHGVDTDERSVPHELDWIRSAVHLSKGCYRGQETVAKIHNLGHPPRRLTFLSLDGSDGVLPAHGDTVELPDDDAASGAVSVSDSDSVTEASATDFAARKRVIGVITSAARHYEDGPIALAVVKRNSPETGRVHVRSDELRIAATQFPIVPASAGATAEVPKLPRLGRRR